MRAPLLILIACVFGTLAASAHADAGLDEFKARIEAALAIDDKDERHSALGALFYRGVLDEWPESVADRMVRKMADHVFGKLAEIQGLDISFAPLSPQTETHGVVDGYETRPNLEPLGYVVFTDPAAAPGNYTKNLYGLHPTEKRYSFPLWERQLVNPDAPPDKQLQILMIGSAKPPVTFEGWCDIALSNNSTKRVILEDQGVGNRTLMMLGQSIEACEVTNTSGRGGLSLRLYEDDRTLFEREIKMPEDSISYRKPQ